MLLVVSNSTTVASGIEVVIVAAPVKEPVGFLESETRYVKCVESVTVIWCVPLYPVVTPPAKVPLPVIVTVCPVDNRWAAEVVTVIVLVLTAKPPDVIVGLEIVWYTLSSTVNVPELLANLIA